MAKDNGRGAKLASREVKQQHAPIYTCPGDGAKMVWVNYIGGQGRGRSALRCEKCGTIRFRNEL
ncbi:MAG: hypothetical protein ACE5HK_02390 [Candidatus Methylomirabilales bacterium]